MSVASGPAPTTAGRRPPAASPEPRVRGRRCGPPAARRSGEEGAQALHVARSHLHRHLLPAGGIAVPCHIETQAQVGRLHRLQNGAAAGAVHLHAARGAGLHFAGHRLHDRQGAGILQHRQVVVPVPGKRVGLLAGKGTHPMRAAEQGHHDVDHVAGKDEHQATGPFAVGVPAPPGGIVGAAGGDPRAHRANGAQPARCGPVEDELIAGVVAEHVTELHMQIARRRQSEQRTEFFQVIARRLVQPHMLAMLQGGARKCQILRHPSLDRDCHDARIIQHLLCRPEPVHPVVRRVGAERVAQPPGRLIHPRQFDRRTVTHHARLAGGVIVADAILCHSRFHQNTSLGADYITHRTTHQVGRRTAWRSRKERTRAGRAPRPFAVLFADTLNTRRN